MSKQLAQGCYSQWNSGATCDSNRGHRGRIPSVLTTKPLSHTKRRTTIIVFVTATGTAQDETSSASAAAAVEEAAQFSSSPAADLLPRNAAQRQHQSADASVVSRPTNSFHLLLLPATSSPDPTRPGTATIYDPTALQRHQSLVTRPYARRN